MSFPIDDLAVMVGVMDTKPQTSADDELQRARDKYNRAGETLVAISFGVVVGTGLLWSAMVGAL
ncbi:putative membrane protein [Corynebacterium deserti GIMN1.010]|uniref:Putative membrane protein n=1 Tax=Corynebacterium deserti GIMN1.010 TaxID=931089 RepID=A0A0M3Q9M5_9CORY|nr:hypothetical protein [Corynebacterium deserti]ALC05949.1 putative membrane protein [Corynebacterium deserti GIMN1.010]